jgi:hypothetical protein
MDFPIPGPNGIRSVNKAKTGQNNEEDFVNMVSPLLFRKAQIRLIFINKSFIFEIIKYCGSFTIYSGSDSDLSENFVSASPPALII